MSLFADSISCLRGLKIAPSFGSTLEITTPENSSIAFVYLSGLNFPNPTSYRVNNTCVKADVSRGPQVILAVGARHEEGVGCVLFEVQQRETPGTDCYNDSWHYCHNYLWNLSILSDLSAITIKLNDIYETDELATILLVNISPGLQK